MSIHIVFVASMDINKITYYQFCQCDYGDKTEKRF